FIFRIDEIIEHADAISNVDNRGCWAPFKDPGANVRARKGVSGMWWLCDSQQIYRCGSFPQGASIYSVWSVYYSSGHGFWVLCGDATEPVCHEIWHPLRFDHNSTDYSSYLTNSGQHPTLLVQRPGQMWPKMLLPDIYHTNAYSTHHAYGGLTGDLPIFLALIAFSIKPESLAQILPQMYTDSRWKTHNVPHGIDKRGVVVYVYTPPETWAGSFTANDLRAYEKGEYGTYYG
ncbi:hypothetical protein BU26DRAFT_585399, partial [Trematosphaeria pertusa]